MDGKNKSKIRRVLAAILAVLVLWSAWSWVPVTERITLELLKDSGKGVRIVLITDLHSCFYGKDQGWLIRRIDKEQPDLILLGGDIFDDIIGDENAKILAEDLVKKYPCYYVTGNHEYWSNRADEMKRYMDSVGVHVLAGDCETITVNGSALDICGIDDPDELTMKQWEDQIGRAFAETDPSHVRILITHRPEKTDIYEKYDFDLIVAGHAHAGQIRIPFINKGVFAPDQGFLAGYVNGAYTLANGSTMVVSRGLARESTPAPRFFNHPEIVTIDLK
ncbi:MAG: metallophosphoesterase [Lachnospiraceae bacterium]|nr:metallophosphoesterase [Lachnospiraceae bacterium]